MMQLWCVYRALAKTAQRILLDLKGKLNEFGEMHPMTAEGLFNQPADNSMLIIAEVESALMNLGYKEKRSTSGHKNAQSDAKIILLIF